MYYNGIFEPTKLDISNSVGIVSSSINNYSAIKNKNRVIDTHLH